MHIKEEIKKMAQDKKRLPKLEKKKEFADEIDVKFNDLWLVILIDGKDHNY